MNEISGLNMPEAINFTDGKAPEALRTIGEVAAALAIRAHVLRYWEEQFPMLRPVKRSGGRRYYRPEDVALVQTIDRLVHRDGLTIRGARQLLAGKQAARGHGHAPAVPQTTPQSDLLAELRAIRHILAEGLAAEGLAADALAGD